MHTNYSGFTVESNFVMMNFKGPIERFILTVRLNQERPRNFACFADNVNSGSPIQRGTLRLLLPSNELLYPSSWPDWLKTSEKFRLLLRKMTVRNTRDQKRKRGSERWWRDSPTGKSRNCCRTWASVWFVTYRQESITRLLRNVDGPMHMTYIANAIDSRLGGDYVPLVQFRNFETTRERKRQSSTEFQETFDNGSPKHNFLKEKLARRRTVDLGFRNLHWQMWLDKKKISDFPGLL